jgi:SAM-dependent methyltransferase
LRQPFQKTIFDSRAIYQRYDDREQRDWESRSDAVLDRGKIRVLPFKEVRTRYVDYLCKELELPARVLEVGCGNGINLVELKARFGDSIELHGIDYSPERLKVSRRYFGERLDGVSLHEGSITARTQWPDGHFDVVFSMHCLEQISHQTHAAVAEMARLAARRVVMIEPVFELANLAQRLYLLNADHVRILLTAIRDLGLTPRRVEPLDIQSNPVNQSSIIVIDKAPPPRRTGTEVEAASAFSNSPSPS